VKILKAQISEKIKKIETKSHKQLEEVKKKNEDPEQRATREDFPADNIYNWTSLKDKDW
jgi:hypothetical protein